MPRKSSPPPTVRSGSASATPERPEFRSYFDLLEEKYGESTPPRVVDELPAGEGMEGASDGPAPALASPPGEPTSTHHRDSSTKPVPGPSEDELRSAGSTPQPAGSGTRQVHLFRPRPRSGARAWALVAVMLLAIAAAVAYVLRSGGTAAPDPSARLGGGGSEPTEPHAPRDGAPRDGTPRDGAPGSGTVDGPGAEGVSPNARPGPGGSTRSSADRSPAPETPAPGSTAPASPTSAPPAPQAPDSVSGAPPSGAEVEGEAIEIRSGERPPGEPEAQVELASSAPPPLPPTGTAQDPASADVSPSAIAAAPASGVRSRTSSSLESPTATPSRATPSPGDSSPSGIRPDPRASDPAAAPIRAPGRAPPSPATSVPSDPATESLGEMDDEMVVAEAATTPARKIFAPQPAYPERARLAGEQGTVVVEGRITRTGDVRRARVLRGASADLDRAALEAFRTWQMQPAERDGEAVDSTYQVAFHFTLERPERESRAEGGPVPGTLEAPLPFGGDFDPPTRAYSPLPSYPESAWATGASGDVVLRLIVDQRGRVRDVSVLQGLPHGISEAAVEAVQRWTFQPAHKDDQPVAVEHRLRLRFTP